MGLFILNRKDSIEDDIECAIMNLKLFLKERERGQNYTHLLDFGTHQIEDARGRLKNEEPK